MRWAAVAGLALAAIVASVRGSESPDRGGQNGSPEEPDYAEQRRRMVEHQLESRDITDARVLRAMQKVPRHLFVPERVRRFAYADTALPIGEDQTISQPYIVALMTQLARPSANSRALDVGTGSGYQAAILGELCKQVYGIEIVESLAASSKKRLKQLGYENIEVRHGDGYRGWKEHAPFDLIILAAAPDHVPEPLTQQLAVGGRLVMPVGRYFQDLIVIEKQRDGSLKRRNVTSVLFVPMTGEAEKKGQRKPPRERRD
jgi:protein-L-isoaspartate(D-aspartate) O-methyltransferase